MTNPSNYYRPSKLAEAAKLANLSDSIALAGGALTLKGVLLPYEHLIDLQDIAELQTVATQDEHIVIGGAVTLQRVVDLMFTPLAIKQALTRALPLAIRNGATVGESLVAPKPLLEWLTVLCAIGASVQHIVNGSTTEQPLEVFVNDVTAGAYHGFVTQLLIPMMPVRAVLGSAFVARTPSDSPIVNAAAYVTVDEAGAVQTAYAGIAGASPTPVLGIELDHMIDNHFDEDLIFHAIKPIAPLVDPIADYKGSVEYRREMAVVCMRRALMNCLEQL